MDEMFDSGAYQLLGEIKAGVEYLKQRDSEQSKHIENTQAWQARTDLRLASLERSENTRRWLGKATVTAAVSSMVAAVFAWFHK